MRGCWHCGRPLDPMGEGTYGVPLVRDDGTEGSVVVCKACATPTGDVYTEGDEHRPEGGEDGGDRQRTRRAPQRRR